MITPSENNLKLNFTTVAKGQKLPDDKHGVLNGTTVTGTFCYKRRYTTTHTDRTTDRNGMRLFSFVVGV